jgi:hypothetical protein
MTTCSRRLVSWAGSGCRGLAIVIVGLVLSGSVQGADVAVHSSSRYYQDASGRPMFLIGYYAWAAAVDGYYIDHPARYRLMMEQGSPYLINYIRIGLQGNRMSGSTDPQSWNHQPTPVAVLYVGEKADLDQFDSVFWQGVRDQCTRARELGFVVDLSLFDGVSLRGGPAWGYSNSWWNPANQVRSFYPPGDYGDGVGAFYRLAEFNNNTGIGYYQRRHIDKAIDTVKDFDNVIFEVGNELAADSAWNSAVISYFKTKCAQLGTNKVITQGGNSSTVGQIGAGVQGWGQHWAVYPAEVKSSLANIVGHGYPAWEDPDNNEWANNLGFPNLTYDTGCRHAAWYAFAGGAPIYGNFTVDFWDWWGVQRGFSTPMATYLKNVQDFIGTTGVHFWNMTPQHNLISNSAVNSCLASQGSEYVAYVLSDASASLNLGAIPGTVYYCLYDPTSGVFTNPQTVAGGGTRSFTRPSGATDWVIYASSAPLTWQTLNVKPAATILVDGSSTDWSLSEFTAPIMGGQSRNGDYGQVDRTHYGGYTGALPTSAADHTAKVYVRHDAGNMYFLARCDDNDIQYGNAVDSNYLNDSVEIYLDPRHDHGGAAINNSTSDIRLVVDANNQKNVYGCTDAYKAQVLAGVVSAVVRDGTGWTLETKLAKNVLAPVVPNTGRFGLEFSFRDNDANNDPATTTVYTWHDRTGTGVPSRIPDNWGDFVITPAPQSPYDGVIPIPGVIQAENYDNGGEGLAYHDSDAVNSGATYRTDGVDIEPCADAGGGYNVGWMDSAEWLAYTVNVSVAGYYDIIARVASPNDGGSLRVQINDQDVASLTVPNTGAWQTWTTVTAAAVSLNAGQQILKVLVDNGGWNVNYIDVRPAAPVNTEWNTLGPIMTVGAGQTPAVATDSLGNIHVVYATNNSVQYRKYNSAMTLMTAEQIAASSASYPHIACDPNNVPHVVFTDPTSKYANICYYTNRSTGSWRSPLVAFHDPTTNLWYPRVSLWSGYAFVGFQYAPGGNLLGEIVRLTNLTDNPTVDRSVTTGSRSCSVVNGLGQVFAPGRYNGSGIFIQQYDSNLTMVCNLQRLMNGYPGSPQTGWADRNNVVHFVSWAIVESGSFPCNDRCGLTYNNTARRDPGTCGAYWPSINSGPGEDATRGPSGTDVSGFWNDDVAPVIAVDALDRVYVAWRAWTGPGEGRITKVDNNAWTQTCTPSTACPGSNVCTGTQFCPAITRRTWWNCEIAPASGGGVYVVWDNAGTVASLQQPPPTG